MREATSEWLSPMLDAAGPDVDIKGLMRQASMHAAEADTPATDWMAANPVPGVVPRGIDWIRFGQLLRTEIGWNKTYPAYPDTPKET